MFLATTDPDTDPAASGAFDTRLFLFDQYGAPVPANDDTPPSASPFQSTLTGTASDGSGLVDCGLSWQAVDIPAANPSAIAFHQAWGPAIGDDYRAFYSADRYATWTRVEIPASALLVHDDRLVGAGLWSGIWFADLPSRTRSTSSRVAPWEPAAAVSTFRRSLSRGGMIPGCRAIRPRFSNALVPSP